MDEQDPDSTSISPFDTAAYVMQMAGELAGMSRQAGFTDLAGRLEAARDAASLALVRSAQELGGKAAADDAA